MKSFCQIWPKCEGRLWPQEPADLPGGWNQRGNRFAADGFERIAMSIEIRAVGEDIVPQVKRFLAGRREFEYVRNWEPCFNYPWKLAQFPYGYAMVDGNEIVGFLGTMFSARRVNGRKAIHCNIHTWIVDDDFRFRLGAEGKGAGRHLIAPLIEMKDVLITALTPSPRSKISCERSGFVSLDEDQVVVPLVTG